MRRYYRAAYVAIYSNNNYVKYKIPHYSTGTNENVARNYDRPHTANNWQESTQLFCTISLLIYKRLAWNRACTLTDFSWVYNLV